MKQESSILKNSILFVSVALLISCTSSRPEKEDQNLSGVKSAELFVAWEGSNLLIDNCYVCHNLNSSSHDDMLAPPLAGIKKRYMRASGNREEFVKRMTEFVSNPNEASALMRGPIKRFGLMPKTALSKEEINEIVKYIYDNEIPVPSWFEEHEKAMHKN
jgi:cytochrome c2